MVRVFHPDVVLSTGEYVAVPVGLAGRYRVVEFVGSELPDVLALASSEPSTS